MHVEPLSDYDIKHFYKNPLKLKLREAKYKTPLESESVYPGEVVTRFDRSKSPHLQKEPYS